MYVVIYECLFINYTNNEYLHLRLLYISSCVVHTYKQISITTAITRAKFG